MPNGEFEKQLAEWAKQTQFHFERVQQSTQMLQQLEQQIIATTKPPEFVPSWLRWIPGAGYAAWGPWSPPGIRARIKPQIEETEVARRRNEFYYRLYSEVPFAITSGKVTSSYDALEKMPQELVNSLSPEDLDGAKDVIDGMVSTITGVTPLPEMAEDMPELVMPEIRPPTEIEVRRGPLTLQRLTTEQIIKALQRRAQPALPSPVLSNDEWQQYLSARQGGVDDPEVDYLSSQAEMLVSDWQERDNQLRAFREGMTEMPDYTLVDMLKEMVVQPGLALMETAQIYFEHVSMPLAGALYKTFVPDIEKQYQEYKQTESTWKALAHAWEEWDAPGEGAWEWILKYMIMEGITDPLTYVGWGIATRITKPLGAVGRLVGGAERGLAQVMELPFDAIKAGLRRFPKSLSQRATLQQTKTIQYVDKWVTKYTGKSIDDLSRLPDGMVRFNNAIGRAIRAANMFPQSESDMVRAGKELLKHTPVDEKMVIDWGNRLAEITGKPGLLTKESVTKELVEGIDMVFEDFSTRGGIGRQKLTLGEAARELLVRLNIDNTEDAWKLAQRILDDRANLITRNALVVGQAVTPVNAIYALGKRNFRIYMATENSAAYLARKQTGAFSSMLQNVEARSVQVWRNSIDRWLVRPFAEAYLAFALYGPMNIFEDIFRSALGNVKPSRVNRVRFSRKWIGTSYDPNLKRDAWSETLGELRKGSEVVQTNWILSMGGLAKGFGEKTYGLLVEKPGHIGIGFRRGFVDGRATQILKEMGGDTFESLVRIDAPHPRLADKKLAREVYEAVNDLKLSADPDSIRYSKELFTRTAIHRREVSNILTEHPDMPRAVRDKLIKDMDDGTLIGNPEQIGARMDESRDILMDDFIRSPERASEQMKQLADMLTDLEVRNPEEMARVMYSLNYMAQVQGAVPKQVMKRVTQRSRGLPFAERSASINADMDRLSLFLERSKDDMQRVADKVKTELAKPVDANVVIGYRGGELKFTLGKTATEGEGLYISKSKEFAQGFGKVSQVEFIKPRNPLRLGVGDELPSIGGTVTKTTGTPWLDEAIKPTDSVWVRLNKQARADVGYSIDDPAPFNRRLTELMKSEGYDAIVVPESIAGDEFHVLLDESLWKGDIKGSLEMPEGLAAGYNRYYDTLMAKSINASDNRMADIARRREYFARATREDLKDTDFWEHFYLETDAHWERVDLEQLEFDDLLQSVAKEMGEIQGVKYPTRAPLKVTDRALAPQDIATVLNVRMDDITKSLMESMMLRQDRARFTKYVMNHVTPEDVGFTPESVGQAYDQIIYSLQADPRTVDWMTPRLKELDDIKNQLHGLYNSKVLPKGEIAEIGRYVDDIARQVDDMVYVAKPPKGRPPKVRQLKSEFGDYNQMRQTAMDEAHKWYYKEFTDYTNANVFDAIMKTIYPYWTYESQRLFWLPRSFVRHPGTFTTFERWQNNTDYGYIHIPGTAIDYNPFRGTVYGTLTTRLARRDFPEYYDQLGIAGDFVEFNDFLSRYGFYPGAHIGIPLAVFGGVEAQFGEVMPAIPKTGLDFMIAAFPDNDSARFISDHIFGDRFRNYLTILQVSRRGGDGTLIFSKMQENQELTEEEQQLWADARREVGWYSAGFEQFAMFRMRTDEQYKMYEESSKVIEEMTGYTPDQQDWLRKHGYRLWDMVGGMSPTEQATLQELEYYKWIGNIRPLLPGRQQTILNQIELAWDDVRKYSEQLQQEKLQLQRDFLAGRIGSQDYGDKLSSVYSKQREYVDRKIEENPLMDLDNRVEYYKEYNVPQPVLHPMRELLNLYFEIGLEEKTDEETGEKVKDWDKFWAMRDAIEQAIPEDNKEEWQDYLARNSTSLEQLRREHNKYVKPYNALWEAILQTYNPEEQQLIKEHQYLVKTGTGLDRRAMIQDIVRENGKKLISNFRSDISNARRSLRMANPYLDAVLFYWGRTTTFQTPQAEEMYKQLARETGKRL